MKNPVIDGPDQRGTLRASANRDVQPIIDKLNMLRNNAERLNDSKTSLLAQMILGLALLLIQQAEDA